ncbi:MAG: hypothetical protein M1831_003831 [Alyxoria varia]|nr:MAG: hypothetical protein M1831_003831 [Alyxoria varia]
MYQYDDGSFQGPTQPLDIPSRRLEPWSQGSNLTVQSPLSSSFASSNASPLVSRTASRSKHSRGTSSGSELRASTDGAFNYSQYCPVHNRSGYASSHGIQEPQQYPSAASSSWDSNWDAFNLRSENLSATNTADHSRGYYSNPFDVSTSPDPNSVAEMVADAGGGAGEMFQIDDMKPFDQIMAESAPSQPFENGGNAPFPDPSASMASWMSSRTQNSSTRLKTKRDKRPRATSDSGMFEVPNRRPGRQVGSKLPEDKREKAALMRLIGACDYCRNGRRACDPGTPCKPCILHYGASVLDSPHQCRRNVVDTLMSRILCEDIKWHPQPRLITDFFGPRVLVTDYHQPIPIIMGFGPPFRREVRVLKVENPSLLFHDHVRYETPVRNGASHISHDYVLPIIFADTTDLASTLDRHIEYLVDYHFNTFNLYNRGLVLDKIYKLYRHYRQSNQEYAGLLQLALKTLVLVSASDLTVDPQDHAVQQLLRNCVRGYPYLQATAFTCCLLRAKLGEVIPQLATLMMQELLQKILRISLSRRCDQHPLVIAVFAVLMMTVESVMYHATRIPFHAHLGQPYNDFIYTSPSAAPSAKAALATGEESATILLNLYKNCYENCHKVLHRTIDERQMASLEKSFGDVPAKFIKVVNRSIADANNYLETKSSVHIEDVNDVSHIFDRLVAKLLLLRVE